MRQSAKKGFTLVELLVGLALSAVLIGAIAVTFNTVNTGVKNAHRSNDLSQTVRNLFILFQNDLSTAGLGFADLATLQIHMNKQAGAAGDLFYPIAELTEDGNGFSDVSFQWFEYDLLNSPTFMVSAMDPAPWNDGDTFSSAILWATDLNNPDIAEIASGDIFLIYNPAINYEFNLHQKIYDSYAIGIEWDESVLANGAMIMQVSGAPVDGGLAGSSALVNFGGSSFGATLTDAPDNPYTEGADPTTLADSWLRQFQVQPPTDAWVARKLGDADSFREVRYFVQNGTLLRTVSNGRPDSLETMVMAENVVDFTVAIGVDVSLGNITDQTAWDGAVAYEDPMNEIWFTNPSTDDERMLVGRHGLAARLVITVESNIEDLFDTQASGQSANANKQRTFATQFRIRNRTRPVINY